MSGAGYDVGAVVVEFGSATTKIGHAGTVNPAFYEPTVYCQSLPAASPDDDVDMGKEEEPVAPPKEAVSLDYMTVAPQVEIRSPMAEDGTVSEWHVVEKMFEAAFQDRMHVRPQEHPMMLVQGTSATRATRQKWAELAFETFETPAVFFGHGAVLACYANGRTSGLSLDFGHRSTRAVPVIDGYVMKPGIQLSEVGSQCMDKYFSKLLQSYTPSVKARFCKQMEGVAVHPSFYDFHMMTSVREIREATCRVSDAAWIESPTVKVPAVPFVLPDGETLEVSADRFRIPELLFKPSLVEGESFSGAMSVQDMVWSAVMTMDSAYTKDLFGNIVVSGGNSFYEGIGARLNREVGYLATAQANRIKVVTAPPAERKLSAWIGGSILGSLPGFHDMWVTRAEYAEHGEAVVERKCP